MMQRSGEPSEASPPNLTGDWGGVRSYLERNGITFTLNYTNDFLANIGGGIKPGAIGLGVFQPQLDLDLEKLAGWRGASSTPMASSPTGLFSVRRISAIFWPCRISKRDPWHGSIRFGTSRTPSMTACLFAPV